MTYIPQEPRQRFPLDVIAAIYEKGYSTRKDRMAIYAGMRAWELWIHGKTFMDKRARARMDGMKFVDYKLTDDEKKSALGHYEGDDDLVLNAMDEVTQAGYRVAFSHDPKANCAIVSVIGRASDCINFDTCMTSRHASVRRALMYAMFKQQHVFGDKAWSDDTGESQWG